MISQDVDLLLSFCRTALSPGESRAYLRPYYDTALRSRLKHFPAQIQGLLEVQWEATQGTTYVKPALSIPTLAFYVLDGKCRLICDFPGGESMCLDLSDTYDVATVRSACYGGDGQLLLLPLPASQALREWEQNTADRPRSATSYCIWEDAVQGFGERLSEEVDSFTALAEEPRPGRFPFHLPAGMISLPTRHPNVAKQ